MIVTSKESLPIYDNRGYFQKTLQVITVRKNTEICGICGKPEPINELGEFIYPCLRKENGKTISHS